MPPETYIDPNPRSEDPEDRILAMDGALADEDLSDWACLVRYNAEQIREQRRAADRCTCRYCR